MPDAWNVPPAAPRHRKPPRRRRLGLGLGLAGLSQVTAAASATARRAKTAITTRPALADHRRAF